MSEDAWRQNVDETLKTLKTEMEKNTAVTMEIREMMVALRFFRRVATWITPLLVMTSVVYGLWLQFRGQK